MTTHPTPICTPAAADTAPAPDATHDAPPLAPSLKSRRAALAGVGAILGAPLIIGSEARAQAAWPTRPVKYINPFPPGGATDILARIYCAKMSEITGQQFVVENIGGGGGDIGVAAIARAAPDGYTVGMGSVASHGISPTLKAGKLPFDAAKDFTFVTNLWSLPNFLVAFNGLPAATVPELIALLRRSPGKFSYASSGLGTTLHISGELFKILAEVDMVHVPYRGGGPAMIDVISGQVQMIFDNIPGALPHFKAGKVKGLGVTSAVRSPVVPEMPALAEFLPGFDINSWAALCGPANLPPAVVERMSMFSKQALESADLKKAFFDRGAAAIYSTPQAATAYRASEEKRLGDIIRKAKITLD
ncbi:MAG TPA: tripartite tricarboxylate transporter substrate-binding protein [Burkholderiaceae bacterium]|nr:tripartite tricarboxylate transporter substrate-binding protein [Burkholderiaceae bacterium]